MADYLYYSSASFYDCANGTPACQSEGFPCDDGTHAFVAAWPNIQGHPPNYGSACFPGNTLVELPCGYWVVVSNVCNPY
jgi:hypothetical protein